VHIGSGTSGIDQVCLRNKGSGDWMDLNTGVVTCDDWQYRSDARLKSNIAGISGSLDRLRQLRGVSFKWKKDEKEGEAPARRLGLVAQEVAEVLPEAVRTAGHGELTISMSALFPVLIESIKELKAEVDDLRSQLAAQAPRKGGKPK